MLRWLATISCALVACHRPLPPQFPGGTRESIDIESGHVLVLARVDGVELRFVVDTAASITSVTPAAAKRLGLVQSGTTRVRGNVVPTAMLRELALSDAIHKQLRVAVVSMREARRLHRRVDGIIGLDVLALHDLVVDFARAQLVLYPSGTLAGSPIASAMARVPLAPGPHGLILLDVGVGGAPIRAVLDLGAPVSYFNVAAARRIVGRPRWLVHPPEFGIGDLRVQPHFVFVEDLPVLSSICPPYEPAMLLGSDAFDDRMLAIGYRDRVAFVSR